MNGRLSAATIGAALGAALIPVTAMVASVGSGPAAAAQTETTVATSTTTTQPTTTTTDPSIITLPTLRTTTTTEPATTTSTSSTTTTTDLPISTTPPAATTSSTPAPTSPTSAPPPSLLPAAPAGPGPVTTTTVSPDDEGVSPQTLVISLISGMLVAAAVLAWATWRLWERTRPPVPDGAVPAPRWWQRLRDELRRR